MFVTHLECSLTGQQYAPNQLYNLSEAGKPLLVKYDLAKAGKRLTKVRLRTRAGNLWRYREVLPVIHTENIVTLGEGGTPLLPARSLGTRMGLSQLFIKDESVNPTGAFKARGLVMAVSMAKELGVKKVAIPSAGSNRPAE